MAGIGPAYTLPGTVRRVGLVQAAHGVADAYDLVDPAGDRALPLQQLLSTLEGQHVTIDVQVDDT